MAVESVISTTALTKRYREVTAVDGLDLVVRRGETYGFLGRNGAGKTTTIRMLLGLVRPSAGTVTLLGRRIVPGETAGYGGVGYLVETAAAYPNLTVRENLDLQRRLTGSAAVRVPVVIELLALGEYADRSAGRLSLGNKQRLALARALLHEPELLILDEPANGLDPAGIVEIRELLRALARDQGVTVFVSTHILSEAAHLADRIGIIHRGRLVAELDRAELAERTRSAVEVDVGQQPGNARDLLQAAGFTLTAAPPGAPPGTLRIGGAGERTPEIARLLVGAGLDLHRLQVVGDDLEDLFLRLTGDEAA